MARKKSNKRTPMMTRLSQHWENASEESKRLVARGVWRGCLALALTAFVAYGFLRMSRSVLGSPTFVLPAKIQLIDVPPDLMGDMRQALAPFADTPWSDPTLCEAIAVTLREVGWVEQVESVRRFADRRIEVSCTYRRPLALVQMDGGFYLVDDKCVRLPGMYAFHPGQIVIQGVSVPAPEAGEPWDAPDLRAGAELVRLIEPERFAGQITGVLVENFHGRVDRRAAHLQLATDVAGGRIIWGSAPGEEIEENSVAAKLELLRTNFKRYGRVDAGRSVIDISVHPDRFITPS
jgi:hypothetical protein